MKDITVETEQKDTTISELKKELEAMKEKEMKAAGPTQL